MGEPTAGLLQPRPVTFRDKQDPSGHPAVRADCRRSHQRLSRAANTGNRRVVESVQYNELIPMLLKELQRQEQLKARNAALAGAAGEGCPPFRLAGKSVNASASVTPAT